MWCGWVPAGCRSPGSLRAAVTGGYESPDVGSGNQTHVLGESSACSCPLTQTGQVSLQTQIRFILNCVCQCFCVWVCSFSLLGSVFLSPQGGKQLLYSNCFLFQTHRNWPNFPKVESDWPNTSCPLEPISRDLLLGVAGEWVSGLNMAASGLGICGWRQGKTVEGDCFSAG